MLQADDWSPIDLKANFVEEGDSTQVPTFLEIDLQVETCSGWISIEQTGAGIWEALIALTATLPEPGQVVLLDEPATYLHSTGQLRLLRYLRGHHQAVVITHSPFMVPAETPDDFHSVVRLAVSDGTTEIVGIGQDDVPAAWLERWRSDQPGGGAATGAAEVDRASGTHAGLDVTGIAPIRLEAHRRCIARRGRG